MVAGLLPFMLQNGLLTKYLVGAQRFTIGPIDFITSAAVLAYGLVGWMVLISLLRRRGRRAVALLVSPIPLGFIVLLLMNGTRQYALGAAVFLFLWGFVFERTTLARWLGSLVLLVGVVYAISALLASTDMQLKDRFSREQLRGEALEGRGLIWTKVVRTTLDHPVLGTGFRNYGENVVGMDKLRHPVVTRDVAHGVIQDVFVEHGLFLGTAFLAGCLHMLVRCWRGLRHERGITAGKGLRAGFMAMLVPLVFSGGFLNAAAVFLLLFLAMVDDRQALLEQLAGPRRSRTKVAGLVPCDEGNIGALTPRSGRGL
jgi:O-antigen ligase